MPTKKAYILTALSDCYLALSHCSNIEEVWPAVCSSLIGLPSVCRVYVIEAGKNEIKQASTVELNVREKSFTGLSLSGHVLYNWLNCDKTMSYLYQNKAFCFDTAHLDQPDFKAFYEMNQIKGGVLLPLFNNHKLYAWIVIESCDTVSLFDENELYALESLTKNIEKWIEKEQAYVDKATSDETLRLTLDASKSGMWEIQLEPTPTFYFSDPVFEILGYDTADKTPNFELFEQLLFPSDRKIVEKIFAFIQLKPKNNFHEEFRVRHAKGHWVWIRAVGKIVHNKNGDYFIGITTDITKYKTNETKLKETNLILQAINEVQSSFQYNHTFVKSIEKLLRQLLKVSNSSFGFIGETLYDEKGDPYLKTHALTNIAWDKETNALYQKHHKNGLEFRNLNTLFGKVLTTAEIVIANDAPNDPRAGGVPIGHPDLHCFLGIPIKKDNKFLGMFGLANNPHGYSMDLVETLQPLISGYANFIEALRIHKETIKTKELYDLIAENTLDTIAIHNVDTTFEYVSPSIEKLFGFKPDEVIGRKPADLFGIPMVSPDLSVDSKIVLPHIKKDGSKMIAEILIKSINDEKGKPIRFLAASRDVTERETILNELEKALEAEKEVNQIKSRFVSVASHEFRTPIATIMSSAELMKILLEDYPDKEFVYKINRHLTRMGNEVHRLTSLLNDILILEKQSLGKYDVNKIQIELIGFVQNLIQEFYLAHDQHERIAIEHAEERYYFQTDPQLLTHILTNLIDNALKYSPPDSKVRIVMFKCNADTIQIDVRDKGYGIPKEEIGHLFESFYRASNTNNLPGTGLGLTIVKQFAEQMGGDIKVLSKENKGSTFALLLPMH
jgi:PAS domain S-box-containing protein